MVRMKLVLITLVSKAAIKNVKAIQLSESQQTEMQAEVLEALYEEIHNQTSTKEVDNHAWKP